MSKLIISGIIRDKQSLLISSSSSSNNASATHRGLDDRNERAELALKNTVEVVRTAGCDKAVSIGEFSEDSDVVGVLVLYSVGH